MIPAMSRVASKLSAPVPPSLIPPLQPGDFLTRPEFERRYDATPGLKLAELIERIVYIPPPATHVGHARPHADLVGWPGSSSVSTPGVDAATSGPVPLARDTMPPPA